MGAMNGSNSRRWAAYFALVAACALSMAAFFGCSSIGGGSSLSGEALYRRDCARCHGAQGEGVAGKYDTAIYGERSLASLAKYIERNMPDDDAGKYKGTPAASNVAEYVYNAFYSRQARARNHPERIELARLTSAQFLNSIADIAGSFRAESPIGPGRGLQGEYLDYHRERDKQKRNTIFTRTDDTINFDFGAKTPDERIATEQFSMKWRGSVLAESTGWHEFRIRTQNGARLYLNSERDEGERPAFIDGWVISGDGVRELSGRVFLIGGRAYPVNLEFFKSKEKEASIKLEWKPPHQSWSVIPKENLSPVRAPVVTVISTPFPPDDSSRGYERGTSVAKEWDRAVTDAAIQLANDVVANIRLLAGPSSDAASLKSFCTRFAERAFRRPLTAEQRKAYVEDQFAATPDLMLALKRTIILIVKSPRFLYPEPASQKPDDWAVASRLALALWDSVPDAKLREAAAAGKLRTPAEVEQQIRRMMADDRAKFKVRGFFEHWLAMDAADEIAKDRSAFPDFSDEIVSDSRESLVRFAEHVAWSSASDYRELLQADYLFVNQRLAKFYGAKQMPRGDGFERIAFDANQRAGIFTHPYLLAAFAYSKSTSPIRRGVFLTRNVMGRFLKPPPKAIAFPDDKFDPSLTMRQKTEELTKSESCQVCHAVINPLGFTLESYDAVGRYRTKENNNPIDPASDYPTSDGGVLEIKGPRDLAAYTANSAEARMGFVQQLFHHVAKQSAGAYGLTTLDRLDEGFAKSNCNIRELIVEIARLNALHGATQDGQIAATMTR